MSVQRGGAALRRVAIGGCLSILLLAGCAMPVSEVQQGGEDAYLLVKGAPPSAVVAIDSASVGAVGGFDSTKNPLRVHGGAHRVRVTLGFSVLIDRTVYFDTGAHVELDASR